MNRDAAAFGPDTFVVRVEGGAMAPAFRDGDYVWIDPDETAADGCFVGVRDPRSRTTVIRWLGREDGRLVLRTIDPPRVERELVGDEEMQIEGVAVLVGNRP